MKLFNYIDANLPHTLYTIYFQNNLSNTLLTIIKRSRPILFFNLKEIVPLNTLCVSIY